MFWSILLDAEMSTSKPVRSDAEVQNTLYLMMDNQYNDLLFLRDNYQTFNPLIQELLKLYIVNKSRNQEKQFRDLSLSLHQCQKTVNSLCDLKSSNPLVNTVFKLFKQRHGALCSYLVSFLHEKSSSPPRRVFKMPTASSPSTSEPQGKLRVHTRRRPAIKWDSTLSLYDDMDYFQEKLGEIWTHDLIHIQFDDLYPNCIQMEFEIMDELREATLHQPHTEELETSIRLRHMQKFQQQRENFDLKDAVINSIRISREYRSRYPFSPKEVEYRTRMKDAWLAANFPDTYVN